MFRTVPLLTSSVNDEIVSSIRIVTFYVGLPRAAVPCTYPDTESRATRTQLSSDGGIDGIIDQDALGLSRVYVQAKRYAPDSSVQRPEIQGFVGALHGNQAAQGVFISTGRFSRGAIQYAESVATRLVLIDGERLTRLMIKYRVGVQVRQTYHVVDLDEDFFE